MVEKGVQTEAPAEKPVPAPSSSSAAAETKSEKRVAVSSYGDRLPLHKYLVILERGKPAMTDPTL